jgi:hypothetical protein
MAAMDFERITAALLLTHSIGLEQPVAPQFFKQLCPDPGF